MRAIFNLLTPGTLLRIWTVIRLPLLILGLYFFLPDEFAWLTALLAIHLSGTVSERIFFFLLPALILGGTVMVGRQVQSDWWRYGGLLGVAFVLFMLLFFSLPGLSPIFTALFLAAVLAANTIPAPRLVQFLTKRPGRWLADFVFAIGIGVSEIFLLRPFLLWLPAQKVTPFQLVRIGSNRSLLGWLPAVILVSAFGSLFLSVYSLADLHRTIYPDSNVRLVARGDFNWLAYDHQRRILFAGGHGFNHLQAYNVDNLRQPPQESNIATGYAQSFAYNPAARELYVYNELSRTLLWLDAKSLELKKSVPMPQVSPGDSWIVWDKISNNIIIASEADELRGFPVVVVSQATGEVLDTVTDIAPGNIILHPTRPLLYMAFFRRDSELFVYNTRLLKVVKSAPAREQLNRMAFMGRDEQMELLIASPVESAVLRFDPETLAYKGAFKTLFGVRSLAVDPVRHLLLCGSLVNHKLEVIDLTTGQRVGEYYIGPWMRTITLDPDAGLAYVSTHEGLFSVRYTAQLQVPDKNHSLPGNLTNVN